jgi:AraC-like DNA-binding protein
MEVNMFDKLMMKLFRFKFGPKQKLALACLTVTVIISISVFIYYGQVHQGVWKQQIRYYQKNQEQNAAWMNSVEQKVNSYYNQLVSNNNIIYIISKNDYDKDDYYTLLEIQKNFLTIINSDSVIDSISLYSRNSGKVLSTQYMFSNLDYFPDHVIINQFYSQGKLKKWFPSRHKRGGDKNSPTIISLVAAAPFNSKNGVMVFNIAEDKLLSKLTSSKQIGVIILDRQNQVICSQNKLLYGVYQRNKANLATLNRKNSGIIQVKDRKDNYYLLTTQSIKANWRIISVIPESLVRKRLKKINLSGLYGILAVLCLSILGLLKLFQDSYSQSVQIYQEKLQTNIHGLIDNAVSGMLTGEYTQEEIVVKSTELGLDLSGDYFMTIVFQINNYYSFLLENRDYLPKVLLCKEIQSRIKQGFEAYKNAVITMELGKIVVLLVLDKEQVVNGIEAELTRLISETQQQVERQYHFTLKVAVSEAKTGIESIQICYAQVLKALNYKYFSKPDSLVFYREAETQVAPVSYYPVTEIAHLKEYLKNGNLSKLEQSIEKICMKLITQHSISGDWVNAIFSNIFYEIIKFVLELGFSSKDIFGDEDLFVKLYSYESVEEKQAYFMKICATLVEYRTVKERNTHKLSVQKIVDYIENNYDKTISLEIVAAQVGMNPSYLSTFIKKELGVHFADYVMVLRLKKALRLLRDGRMTVKQIAEECGFDTVHSFIRNFKKYYQLTPSEFRNQNQVEKYDPI